MPIHEIICGDCGFTGEVITLSAEADATCPKCGSANAGRLLSPTSSLTGKTVSSLPGAGDTGCCGSKPGTGSCAGPGTCCGKAHA